MYLVDSSRTFTEPLESPLSHLVLLKVVYQLLGQLARLSEFLAEDEVNWKSLGVMETDTESTAWSIFEFLDICSTGQLSSSTCNGEVSYVSASNTAVG